MSAEYIYLSAANSTDEAKVSSDFVCTGKHDELTIQTAIDACVRDNKNLYFFNGIYSIDGFYHFEDGGPDTAIRFPGAHREITVMGQNHEYGCQRRYDNGVVLYVSAEALNGAGEASVDVLRSAWTQKGVQNGSSLHLENLVIILAHNQRAVRCVDLRRTDRVEVKNMTLLSYGDGIAPDSLVGLNVTAEIPAKGCIGLTMTDGSNYEYSDYTNVQAIGFDEGIQVGGEHVVCINCGGSMGNYGFTFGNYECNCGLNHPVTLINCLDERNVNLPYFGRWCGDSDGKGGRLIGNQEVAMISFNVERTAAHTPGGVLGDLMREEVPGTWKGNIAFTAQPSWWAINTVDFKLWESDGSGSGFMTRNNTHKAVCTTEERLSYYPTLGQQIFDIDLQKMVVCTDPDQKTWVDFMGNKV
ncbi:MAG: hypothetical protein IIX15_01395 [Clostridia bacterium]|nr:hypothetical protein [Clostridia bacterium]